MHKNPNATFKLAANIDMSEYSVGEGWKPVSGFTGKLDGRNYTINNLKLQLFANKKLQRIHVVVFIINIK